MSPEAWESEHAITADDVRLLLSEQIAELKDARVSYFNEGWDTWIFEVNESTLFRFPKREESDVTLQMELRLLPELEDVVPLPIPSFVYLGAPSKSFPYHFAGYEKMSGETAFDSKIAPPHPDKVARQLGQFLAKLHAFPRAQAEKLNVPLDENLDVLPVIQKDALGRLEAVRDVLPEDFSQSVGRCLEQELSTLGRHGGPSRLIHNDLCSEHILLSKDGTRVTGVLDWGDAEFGDPAMDFAGLLAWLGPGFLDEVLQVYPQDLDPNLRRRAQFLACCEGVGDIHYGMRTGKKKFAISGTQAARNALRRA